MAIACPKCCRSDCNGCDRKIEFFCNKCGSRYAFGSYCLKCDRQPPVSHPKPAALSPEMLGEEDRKTLAYVKQLVLDYRRRMSLKRLEVGSSNDADVVWYYDNEVEQAHKGVLLLLRLLGSADGK